MRLVTGRHIDSKNSLLIMLEAVVEMILGIVIVAWPQHTLVLLIYLFGTFVVVDGLCAIGYAIVNRTRMMVWWALLLTGIIGIVVGIVIFVYPRETALVLAYLIASWALLVGIFQISGAFITEYSTARRWLNALMGILCFALAILIFVEPATRIVSLTWLIGAFCIVYGALLLIRVMFPQIGSRAASRESPEVSP